MTGKVETSLNLLITRAEVEDIAFIKGYSKDSPHHLRVEIKLYAGANMLTSMYLSSNEDISSPKYIAMDGTIDVLLQQVLESIKRNANISLERVGRNIEAPVEEEEEKDGK